LKAGIGFPYECNSGGCGTCVFQTILGEFHDLWPDAPGLSERARRKGDRKLACQTAVKSDATITVSLDDRCCPRVLPQVLDASVVQRRALTHDMLEFTMHSASPANFVAGQYMLVKAEGCEGARAYSMSNLPNGEGLWQFIVKRKQGGSFTQLVFESLHPGSRVTLRGPYGMAFYDEREMAGVKSLVCIAGGSGLSPILSIVRAALRGIQPPPHLQVFYGGRERCDIVDFGEIRDLARSAGVELKLCTAISDQSDLSGWEGERGYIHEVAFRHLEKTVADYEAFLAGPPPMIRETLKVFNDLGLERSRIHFDNFF
jgi:NAD(P)H-flavin reductase